MQAAMAAVTLLWSYREMSGLSPVKVLLGTKLRQLSSRHSRELTQASSGARPFRPKRSFSTMAAYSPGVTGFVPGMGG